MAELHLLAASLLPKPLVLLQEKVHQFLMVPSSALLNQLARVVLPPNTTLSHAAQCNGTALLEY